MAQHYEINPDQRGLALRVANRALRVANGLATARPGNVFIPNKGDDGMTDGTGTWIGSGDVGNGGVAPWIGDTTPPGKPTGITCSSAWGTLYVNWDGTLEGGVPADFAYVSVLVDGAEIARMVEAGTAVREDLENGTTVQVTAVAYDAARDRNGNPAPNASEAFGPVSVQISDERAEIDAEVEEIKGEMEQAAQDAADAKEAAAEASSKADAAADKADSYQSQIDDVTATVNGVEQEVAGFSSQIQGAVEDASQALTAATEASQDLAGFKTTVSQTYETKAGADAAMAQEVLDRNSAIEQSAGEILSTVSQNYVDNETGETLATKAELEVTADSIRAEVEETYQSKDGMSDYATNSSVTQTANSIKQEVAAEYTTKEDAQATYATKTSLQQTEDSILSSVESEYQSKDGMSDYATNSSVTQTANSIKSEVSETYTTKTEFEGLEVGGTNLLYDTKDMTVKISSGNAQRVYTTYASNVGNGGGLVRTADGIKLTFGSNTNVSIQAPLASFGNVENGETVTLSFIYRGNITRFGHWYFLQQTLPNVSVGGFPGLNADGQWHEYKYTFSSPDANVRTCLSVLMFYSLPDYDKTKWIEIKEGTLKLEKGTKATDWSPAPEDMLSTADASATYATKTSLTSVEQTVDGLKSTVSSNYTTLNNKFGSYYTKTQVDQKEDAIQLNAQRIAGINYNQAKMLYTDPCFEKGLNGVIVYNLFANGNVTITRQSGNSSDPFTFSNYRLMIQNKGTSNPGCGGFYFGNQSRANAVFLYRIWALIPVDRNINWRSNSLGTGSNVTWLSSTAGTGAFEEYVCVATCGSTGSFETIGYFYIDGAVGTSSAPVTWYVAYATCFDVTGKSDYSTLRVDVDSISSRVVDAEGNISSLEQTSGGLELRLTQAEKDVDTAQSTANTAKTTANNAAKTATNYLKFDSSGLVVGNHTGTLQGNVLVDSTGMSVRNGTTVYAKYAANLVELGRNSTSSKVKMCGGIGEFSVSGNELRLKNTKYDATIKLNTFGVRIDPGDSEFVVVDNANVGSPRLLLSGTAWKSGSRTVPQLDGKANYRLFACLVSGWGSSYLIGVLIGNQIAFFKAEAWDSYNNPANFAVSGIRINVSGDTWTLNGAARVNLSSGYAYPFGGITAIYGIY